MWHGNPANPQIGRRAGESRTGGSTERRIQAIRRHARSGAERNRRTSLRGKCGTEIRQTLRSDAAQAKAEQAAQLNVAFKLFEDMPEVVLNEIEERRSAENVARKSGKPSDRTPRRRKQNRRLN